MWQSYTSTLHTSEQLVTVPCELILNKPSNQVSIPDTTDFGFILSTEMDWAAVDVMECQGGFCILRVDTQACVSSHYNAQALPSTPANMLLYLKIALSMTGLFASKTPVGAISMVESTSSVTKQIRYQSTVASQHVMEINCKNENNDECTPEETV